MTADELKAAQRRLGLNRVELAKRLKTPLSTVRDWCRGNRPIPGVCEVAVEGLLKHDEIVMRAIIEKVGRGK